MVGYYGLGEDWIFRVQPKGEGAAAAAIRQQIVDSVTKAGEPHVYSSIATCIDTLAADVDESYSKWLVVLTDTADFQCFDEKGRVDKMAPARAESAVSGVLGAMQKMSGLHFVVIDASGIANFNAKHTMWPTWRKMSYKLTDECGKHNTGMNIEAGAVEEIDEAFEKVAGEMTGGAAS